MDLSVLITSLPTPFDESLRDLARLGFQHVDLIGVTQRSEADREALANSGLIVDCVALGRGLPEGCALDAADVVVRRRAVEEVKRQIAEAAQLGARVAYVVACKEAASLPAFADACQVLAGYARGRMMQLCVEHFPGSALPAAARTLDWLNAAGLDEMNLLLDLGHCLISREDPCVVVDQANRRLGYVHLDDNDGVNDVHWPLLSGVLTEGGLRDFLRVLRDTKYRGGVALEFKSKLDDPMQNVIEGKRIVEGML
jgi:sugar phosphate isomerase/epimerase